MTQALASIWPQLVVVGLTLVMAIIWQVTRRMQRRERLPPGVARFLDGTGAKVLGALLLVVALALMAIVVEVVAAIVTR